MTVTHDDIARARASMPRAFRAAPRERLRRALVWALLIGLTAYCLWSFEITPQRIWSGLGRLGTVMAFMFPPHVWTSWAELAEILHGLGETLSMAFLGTLLGAVVAFPLSFLGAKNINRLTPLRMGVRRSYDMIRAFETLILALIFIRAFGLGPLAGILAIAVSEIGSFASFSPRRSRTRPRGRLMGSRRRAGRAFTRSATEFCRRSTR
jgi:phosphonate transport system permease protein